jgi:hypothetical protein
MEPMTAGKLAAGVAGTAGAGSIGLLTEALVRITAPHAAPTVIWMTVIMVSIAVPAAVASLALILSYWQKKLEMQSAVELEKARQEMYRVLLEKSAGEPTYSANYQQLINADALHLSVERNGSRPSGPQAHRRLYGSGPRRGGDRWISRHPRTIAFRISPADRPDTDP